MTDEELDATQNEAQVASEMRGSYFAEKCLGLVAEVRRLRVTLWAEGVDPDRPAHTVEDP